MAAPVSLGTKADTTGTTATCAILVGTAVAVGDTIWVLAGCNVTALTATCADTKNTYTRDALSNGAGNSSYAIFSAPCTVALTTSDTITVTWSANAAGKLAGACTKPGAWTLDAGKTVTAAGSANSTWASGNITPSVGGTTLLGGAFDNAANDGTSSATAPNTIISTFNAGGALGFDFASVYQDIAGITASQANGVFTVTGGDDWKSVAAIYKPPASGITHPFNPVPFMSPPGGNRYG